MSIDIKQECKYCYREIDNNGLEGFRCINKTVNMETSWCRPKNADESCSICEYCEPKEEIEMSIDKAIKRLIAKEKCMELEISGIDAYCNNHNCDNCDLCYEQGNMGEQKETLKYAVDIMRKYQKIQDIYYHQTGQALENSLRAVIDNGKID